MQHPSSDDFNEPTRREKREKKAWGCNEKSMVKKY